MAAALEASGGARPRSLKVYFAGSIRGGRDDAALYGRLIEFIVSEGHEVLTEHVGLDKVAEHESSLSEKEIYDRDMEWLNAADCVVAEVTKPSLGVGYELGVAEYKEKPTLCLFRGEEGGLSAMITGCKFFQVRLVSTEDTEKEAIRVFLSDQLGCDA